VNPPSRVAVITDIHANLPALEETRARIDELDVERVYCGGDLVGYGPRPNEVCRPIEEHRIPTIYGNYDYAIARDEEDCGCAYVTPEDRELGQRSIDSDPRGAFALLVFENGEVTATIERIPYDAEAVAREVAEAGLPTEYAEELIAAT